MWYHRNTKANPFVGGTRLLWQKTWAQGFPITLADFLGLPDNPRLFYPTLSQTLSFQFSSDTQSCLTLCDHMNCSMAGLPVHPGVYPESCPLSRWCHPTISTSVVSFSSRLQSFPASGSFPMSHFYTSGGQSIGISASVSVLPVNIQDWYPLGWTGWNSLQSKGLSRVFSNTTVQKHQFFGSQLFL